MSQSLKQNSTLFKTQTKTVKYKRETLLNIWNGNERKTKQANRIHIVNV